MKKTLFFSVLALWLASAPSYADFQVIDPSASGAPTKVASTHTSSKHKVQPPYIFAQSRPATGNTVFIFDPKVRQWAVYDASGVLLKTGRGSGGQNYCRDIRSACRTPVGVYQVYAQRGGNCKSKKFPIGKGGAPMPYCSFFHGGFAIHGSRDVRSYNASHGCIRVEPSAARWIQSVMPIGSTVIVRPY